MSNFQNDSIFWIEVEKIKPNPFQPRKEFSEDKLNYLAESIRQYGVLQPLVVTRQEIEKPDGGLMAEYELIAGERRLRASKIAGLSQVPAIIRTETQDNAVKLELAIIENLQREDLNPIDRAMAFQKLVDEFGLKHIEIGKKMGKSREYVSNSLRLLSLPEDIKNALASSQISEGHARPLMMLRDKPEEQMTLFKEIIYKKLTVRDAESIAKKVAYDKVRRKTLPPDPEMMELEGQLAESLGTRVQIERKEVGGKLTIDFFSSEDLKKILDLVHSNDKKSPTEMLDNYIQSNGIVQEPTPSPESHPHTSVEEEVAKRPMSEITDTATDEIDEKIQKEINEEVKVIENQTSSDITEENISNEGGLKEEVQRENILNNNEVEEKENFETQFQKNEISENAEDFITKEKDSFGKKEISDGIGLSEVSFDNTQPNKIENEFSSAGKEGSDNLKEEEVEIIPGDRIEETDIESMTSTSDDNQNLNSPIKEENFLKEEEPKIEGEDDLYSIKDFGV